MLITWHTHTHTVHVECSVQAHKTGSSKKQQTHIERTLWILQELLTSSMINPQIRYVRNMLAKLLDVVLILARKRQLLSCRSAADTFPKKKNRLERRKSGTVSWVASFASEFDKSKKKFGFRSKSLHTVESRSWSRRGEASSSLQNRTTCGKEIEIKFGGDDD